MNLIFSLLLIIINKTVISGWYFARFWARMQYVIHILFLLRFLNSMRQLCKAEASFSLTRKMVHFIGGYACRVGCDVRLRKTQKKQARNRAVNWNSKIISYLPSKVKLKAKQWVVMKHVLFLLEIYRIMQGMTILTNFLKDLESSKILAWREAMVSNQINIFALLVSFQMWIMRELYNNVVYRWYFLLYHNWACQL